MSVCETGQICAFALGTFNNLLNHFRFRVGIRASVIHAVGFWLVICFGSCSSVGIRINY